MESDTPSRDAWAMSQENVELIKRGYEAWNRNDLEGVLQDLDPELEWLPRLGAAGVRATLYRGHEGVLAYKREVEEALGGIHVDVLSIEDLGEHVLAHIRATGQGSASGAQVEADGFHLWTIHAGRAIRFATYSRRAEALEAAGLSE
jgi:ketosteroid isomerase-like protein